jgi:hypothetical protein
MDKDHPFQFSLKAALIGTMGAGFLLYVNMFAFVGVAIFFDSLAVSAISYYRVRTFDHANVNMANFVKKLDWEFLFYFSACFTLLSAFMVIVHFAKS